MVMCWIYPRAPHLSDVRALVVYLLPVNTSSFGRLSVASLFPATCGAVSSLLIVRWYCDERMLVLFLEVPLLMRTAPFGAILLPYFYFRISVGTPSYDGLGVFCWVNLRLGLLCLVTNLVWICFMAESIHSWVMFSSSSLNLVSRWIECRGMSFFIVLAGRTWFPDGRAHLGLIQSTTDGYDYAQWTMQGCDILGFSCRCWTDVVTVLWVMIRAIHLWDRNIWESFS